MMLINQPKSAKLEAQNIPMLEAMVEVVSADEVDWARLTAVSGGMAAPPIAMRTKDSIYKLRDTFTWDLMMLYKEHGPLKKLAPHAKWMIDTVEQKMGSAGVDGDPLPLMLLGVGLFYQLGGTHAPYDAPELWQALKHIEKAFKNDERHGRIGPKNSLMGRSTWARICRIRGDDATCERLIKEMQQWLDDHPFGMTPADARRMVAEECHWDNPDDDWMVQRMRFQGGMQVDGNMWLFTDPVGQAPPS